MSTRLATVCLVLLVLLLNGCGGGGGNPGVVAGDYYPLTVGTKWTYDTQVEVETASQLFATTGTFTRTLSSLGPVTVGGKVFQAFRFDQTSTVNAIPDLSLYSPKVLADAVKYLFRKDVGLQPVSAFYLNNPATATVPSNVSLLALSENGAPPKRVPTPMPKFYNPPYAGVAENFFAKFIPTPLMPPTALTSNLSVRYKDLDYGTVAGLNGPTHAVIDIYHFASDVNLGGAKGQIGGLGRNFFLKDIGLASGAAEVSDWTGRLQISGVWARIYVSMALKSMN